MDLSIVTISSDNKPFLGPCLDSLHNFKNGFSLEVIVVDNNSRDDSVSFVKKKYPEAVLVESKEKKGFAYNNNLGIKKSRGNYILLLNADTVIESDTLKKMLKFMNENKDCGLAGCRLYDKNGNLEYSCKEFPTPFNVFLEASMLERLLPTNRIFGRRIMGYFDHNSTKKVDWVCGAFMLVRKEIIDEIGYLDSTFFMYYEDTDWCYRIKKSDWNVYYVPEAGTLHYKGGSTTGFNIWAYTEHYKNLFYFYKKHYSVLNQFLVRCIIFCGMILKSLLAMLGFITISKRRQEMSNRLRAYFRVIGLSFAVI